MSKGVKYYLPDTELNWLVIQYETIQFDGKLLLTDRFVPRVDIALVFHFKDTPIILEPKQMQLPIFFIAPVMRKSMKLEVDGILDTLIITCLPSVLSRSLKIDLSPAKALNIHLDYDKFYPLWSKMKRLESTEMRIACFSEFVNSFQHDSYSPDMIDIAYRDIVENSILLPFSETLKDINIDERTLQRSFLKRIGVSPKMLARIARVNHLWEEINRQKATSYQDLVYLGNYFDQSHFIKDFKNLVGETPSHFFKRNLKMVKMLSGKQ
jgi:AraC-like DNA-binding protein